MNKTKFLFFLSTLLVYTQILCAAEAAQLTEYAYVFDLLNRIISSEHSDAQKVELIKGVKNKVASNHMLLQKINEFLFQKGFPSQSQKKSDSSMVSLADILVLLNNIVKSSLAMQEKEQLLNNLWKKLASRPDLKEQMNIFLEAHGYPVVSSQEKVVANVVQQEPKTSIDEMIDTQMDSPSVEAEGAMQEEEVSTASEEELANGIKGIAPDFASSLWGK